VETIIVDTGPIVALFNANDSFHAPVRHWFEKQSAAYQLVSCEAVITEAAYMLGWNIDTQTACLSWVQHSLTIQPIAGHANEKMGQWMRQYANVPMDFADACVLWLYLEHRGSSILTLDQRGFGVFRLPGQRKFPSVVTL
jgi:uncharacterized protein